MIDTEKLFKLMKEVAREKGPFTLFGLFLREEAEDRWDLVVSASWLEQGKLNALEYLSKKVVSQLSEPELLSLSRIVTLNEGDPALGAILHDLRINGGGRLQGENLFGLPVKDAVIAVPATIGIKKIAEEVMEQMAQSLRYTKNVFEFRGRGLMPLERGSPIWQIRLWFQGEVAIDIQIEVPQETTDEEIRNQITHGMESRLRQLNYGDRLDTE